MVALLSRAMWRQRPTPKDPTQIMTLGRLSGALSKAFLESDLAKATRLCNHTENAQPGVTRCDPLLRFEDIARAVADFDRSLRPDGLLAICHSNFRLCDTAAGHAFETVMQMSWAGQTTPIFRPDNRLMEGLDYPDTVFRKREER
jgi:hypothetical protein